ncbi:NAD(P)/FAD-dependent oxidoreductase [Chloroflexi bacterium]|nr:NAD(P)/FAD-dependent oxidoreductase [Chloroflexota bacterium]
MKFGIIGAGATGLAAAYDLSRKGHQVKIFEASDFIGGHASTFQVAGSELEKGYHHWFTNDEDIISLITEIGLEEMIGWYPSSVGTYQNGHIYKFLTPFDLLRFSPLSFLNRIKMGLSSLKIRYVKDWHQLESISAKEWLIKNTNQQIYESFWEPMLRGKFGEKNHDRISMAWIWGKMTTRFASRKNLFAKEVLGYPQGSFSFLFEKLADLCKSHSTEIFLSTRVNRIKGLDSGKIAMSIGPEASEETFDAVISSTPSHIFDKITEGLSEEYRSKLTSIEYMAAVLLILVMDRPFSNVYWLNIADRSIPFIGIIEHTNLVGTKDYGSRHIAYLSNYLPENDPLFKMTGQELYDTYLPHLKKINSDFESNWIKKYHHFKIPNAQPVVDTNYKNSIPEHETGIANLYLANTSQVYPQDRGTNYSIAMGRKMAYNALKNLQDK